MTSKPKSRMGPRLSGPAQAPSLASRLRPHELIAMLTHHYARARARSLPRVKTTLAVSDPGGRQAVTIGWPSR